MPTQFSCHALRQEPTGGTGPASVFLPESPILLRAPILPVEAIRPLLAQTFESATAWHERTVLRDAMSRDLEQIAQWVRTTCSTSPFAPVITEALLVASPDFEQALSLWLHGEIAPKKGLRILNTAVRYLTRMALRPTPFGLCAGVALGELGEQTAMHLGAAQQHRTRTRLDMGWLLSLIRHLERDPSVADQLTWFPNPLLRASGARILLSYASAHDERDVGVVDMLSLRATPLIQHILDLARLALPRSELKRRVASLHPSLPHWGEQHIEALCANDVLLSPLRPPLTCVAPHEYLLAQLERVSGTDALRESLDLLVAQCADYDASAPGEGHTVLTSLVRTPAPPLPGTPAVNVDCQLTCTSAQLSHVVAEDVARAAELLCRLSPTSVISPALQAYEALFLARYGPAREVPILEVLDAVDGLGPPPTYAFPAPTTAVALPAAPSLSQREQMLAHLASTALRDQQHEMLLTEEQIHALQGAHDAGSQWLPDSLDLFVVIDTSSQEALNTGDYLLAIGPRCAASPAGRAWGRFCDLLGEGALSHLSRLAAWEEQRAPDTLFAEVVYLPTRAHAANVALRPAFRSHEIPIGTTAGVPQEQVVELDSIVAGLHHHRFYLRSCACGRMIRIRNTHLLNLSHAVPNVVRFLAEVAGEQTRVLHPFSWGKMSHLPFLPRLRFGRVVLSPAQWSLSLSDLRCESGMQTDPLAWYQHLQRWRAAWRVPRYVWLGDGDQDQRVLLDLDNPLSTQEVRAYCQRDGAGHPSTVVQELFPSFEQAWVAGDQGRYMLECVVSLTQRATAKTQVSPVPSRVPSASRADRLRLPGSDWLYLKLYCREEVQRDVLAGPVRLFLEQNASRFPLSRWFFVRYHDPLPHLRLRFQADPRFLRETFLPVFLAWSQEASNQEWILSVVIDSYEREIERYVGKEGMAVAEEVFTLDSAFVLDLLQLSQQAWTPLLLGILSVDVFLRALGLDQGQRHTLYQRAQQDQADARGEDLRSSYAREQHHLPFLLGRVAWLAEQEEGRQVVQCLQHYALLFHSVKTHLEAVPDEQMPLYLGSLVHMHCNRLLGQRLLEQEVMYCLARVFERFAHARPPGIILEGIDFRCE